MEILQSKRKDKRFVAKFVNGSEVHFGNKGSKTYIDGTRTKEERNNYRKRHELNPLESKMLKNNASKKKYAKTASVLSNEILWGESKDINENIRVYKKKFL